ncbi:MAG TPA: D-aminoacylase [Longimicrobiales bacterium]|nr:D-aminoacylase [Longimicrobiales bacterium]
MRRPPVRLLAVLALTLAACAPPSPGAPSPAQARYDIVVEGGRVVDGTGSAWFYGDVGITGDRIAAVLPAGMLRSAPARERIDARGMVVAPGFIDIQSHSRGDFLRGDGRVVSKVTQGITTEILGEGSTNAPLSAAMAAQLGDGDDARQARAFEGQGGFDRWLRAMEENGTSPNFGSFVGAGTIRVYGMGEAMGAAGAAQLDSMRKAVRWAMEEGAFGVASALIYPPGNFASTQELIELGRAMRPYGGVYITHMRSEADQLLEAIDEAIHIGREAGVPAEIYHLKAAGTRNYPKMARAIAKIDSARAAGVDVQANMYPYTAGGTGLTACLPPWASAEGKLYDNLADAEMRARIRAEVLSDAPKEWEDLCGLSTPDGVLLLGLQKPENRRWRGVRLSEVADAMGKHWFDAAVDLLVSERQRIGTIYFFMDEDNVRLKLRQPWMKFGTDAGGYDPTTAEGLAHPRAYGTYPRILGRYVREEGVLELEDAIRKMSSAVATRLSIPDRGVLKEGFYADLVVFDPATITDHATFEDPHRLSTGVRDVLVNGVPVVRGGVHTGERPGRAVRGPGYRER